MPRVYNRCSIRLKDYDYSTPGGYFVTICTYKRECTFGEVVDETMRLSPLGRIVQEEWLRTSIIRPDIELDAFTIMPNHIHGIIVIKEGTSIESRTRVGMHSCASLRRQPKSLGSIIAGFKSATTKRINEMRNELRRPVWQNRFYDHIIRTDKDLDNIREYILHNPLQWSLDEENPDVGRLIHSRQI
jgi:putative transposase